MNETLGMSRVASPGRTGRGITGAALLSAVLLGGAIGLEFAEVAVTLALGTLVLVSFRFQVARMLALSSFLLLVPPAVVSGISPQYLLLAGEVTLAFAILVGGRSGRIDAPVLWTALMFGTVLVLAGGRGLETPNPDANPLLGAIVVGAQALFVAAGACRFADDSDFDVFAGVVSVVGILLATWAVAEFALNQGLAYPLVSGARRSVGPFGNPNYFGALLASLAVLGLAIASNRKQQRRPIALPALAAVGCSAGVLTTLSRGAMLGLLVGIIVLLSIWSPKRRRRQIFVLSTVVLVIVTTLAWRWIAAERVRVAFTETDAARVVSEADEESLRYRYDAAKLAFSYTLEHPWLGIGLNRFPAMAQRDERLGIYMNTHNEPLRISSEAGLPAFFLLVFFVWTVVGRIKRRRLSVAAHAFPVMACYGVTSLFLNGLGNVILTFPVVAVMFLAAGMPADTQVRGKNLGRAVPVGPRR